MPGTRFRSARAAAVAVVISVFLIVINGCAAPPAAAQFVPPEVESESDKLDVPFVPSTNAVLDTMYVYTAPTRDDYLIDLGSGDGRIVINAARRFGTPGHGVDLNEGLVKIANETAQRAGVGEIAKFHVRDLFQEDISQATIVTMYLLPEVVMQLRQKLFKELRPGTRIASHDYHMGDWRFDAAKVVDSVTKGEEDVVYYWKVPAKVAGFWTWTVNYPGYIEEPRNLTGIITQHYQDIAGRVQMGLQPMRIHDAKMDGTKISFSVTGELDDRIVRHDYAGTVDGNRITGTVTLSGGVESKAFPWSAFRSRADN